MKGKVKYFSKEKGYGFILGEDKKDYFFHYSQLDLEGFKLVNANDEVEFESFITTNKGFKVEGMIKVLSR